MMRTVLSQAARMSAVAVISLTPINGDETKNDTRQPSRNSAEILERFIAECVSIKPGTDGFPEKFFIGAEKPAKHELARKEARLIDSFRVSKYEVTQELYKAITRQNPSRWQGPRNSVENLTWNDAVAFCGQLTKQLREKNLIDSSELVRLPTAVEWEYCCRAGKSTRFGFGDKPGKDGKTDLLDAHAWHTGNAAGNDPAVGVLKPNAWGLYDCHGYLWEFVSDVAFEPVAGGETGRIIRGGSWKDHHSLLSSSTYLSIPVGASSDAIGFRCVIARDTATKNTHQQ